MSSAVKIGIALLVGTVEPIAVAQTQQPLQKLSVGEGRAKDLAIVRTQFLEADKSYTSKERRRASLLLSRLERDAADLSASKYELALAEIAASADNAHTMLFSNAWKQRFNALPVTFLTTRAGIYVAEAVAPFNDLVGLRVDTIDFHTADDLRKRWARYKGGNEAYRNATLHDFIESPEILHAAGLTKKSSEVTFVGVRSDGTKIKRILPAQWPPTEDLLKQNKFGSRLMWLSRKLPDNIKPLYLREPAKMFRAVSMPEYAAMYVQFRANSGASEGVDIKDFAQALLAQFESAKPNFIIVDNRFNSGGDLNATRNLMVALGRIVGPNGHVFILTSGETFSAGISSVGYAKQGAIGRVTVIGEEVGDELEFWAEGSIILLSSVYNGFRFSTERHNYQTGCQEADCHQPIKAHPITIDTLAPDRLIRLTYADFVANQDAAMDEVMRLMRLKNNKI